MDIIPICQKEHCKILAGRCPWCGRTIVNGRPEEAPALASFANADGMANTLEHKLREKLDLSRCADIASPVLRREIRLVVEVLFDAAYPTAPCSREIRDKVIDDVLDRVLGLAPP